MRNNFNRNKRKIEEAKRIKQEAKRLKKLNKKTQETSQIEANPAPENHPLQTDAV